MSVLVCKIFLTYLTSLKVPLQQGDQPVNPKGNQPWIFIESTDAEAEAPDVKSWLTGQDPGAGKDWRQKEKGTTEDEMVGWHHRLNRHEFEQTVGDSEGQEAWRAEVPGVTKGWAQFSNWTTTTNFFLRTDL